MAKVIEAKHDGICPICNKTYGAGTRIAQDSKTGKWAMADCLWPDKKGQNNTGVSTQGKEGGPPPPSSKFDVEAYINANFNEALDWVKEVCSCGHQDAISKHEALLVERMREQYGLEQTFRIQRNKIRNMQAIN